MKIVSLLPSASEVLGALGLSEQVVAVSHECDYPAEMRAKPRITSSILGHSLEPKQIDAAVNEAVSQGRALYQIDGDLLARLQPDLIVTQGICDVCAVGVGTIEAALKFLPDCLPPGAQTVTLSGTTFEGILRDIQQVARAAGVAERGDALVAELRGHWQQLEATPKIAAPRVTVLEWNDPPFSAGHWVPEMVAVAGDVEVLGEAGELSRRVSWAEIAEADPDTIVMAACGYGLAENVGLAEGLYAYPDAGALRAVRAGQVYAVDANAYFSRPGPRVVRGAEVLQQLFRGEPSPEIVRVAPVTVSR